MARFQHPEILAAFFGIFGVRSGIRGKWGENLKIWTKFNSPKFLRKVGSESSPHVAPPDWRKAKNVKIAPPK